MSCLRQPLHNPLKNPLKRNEGEYLYESPLPLNFYEYASSHGLALLVST